MANRDRFKLLFIGRNLLSDILAGAARISNLPHNFHLQALADDPQRDGIWLRICSDDFPEAIVEPGRIPEEFAPQIEFENARPTMVYRGAT